MLLYPSGVQSAVRLRGTIVKPIRVGKRGLLIQNVPVDLWERSDTWRTQMALPKKW